MSGLFLLIFKIKVLLGFKQEIYASDVIMQLKGKKHVLTVLYKEILTFVCTVKLKGKGF